MSQTKVQLVDFGSAVAASTPTNGPFISAANTVSISTNSTERFKISSTGEATVLGGNLTLNAQGDLRLADADSSNFIALQAPSTISSNVTLTLPSADGTNGQALTTNGSGTLSFTTISTTSDKITEGNTEAEVVDTGSNGHFKVTTEGTERFRITSSGNCGISTASPGAFLEVAAGNRAVSGQGGTVTVGGDVDSTGITNNTRKVGFINVPHYANATGKMALIFGDSQASENVINIGGSQSNYTAATSIAFWTAANNTTTVGTERFRCDSSGRLLVGTSSSRSPSVWSSPLLQVESTAFTTASISVINNQAADLTPAITIGKSRGTSTGSNTIVQNGDTVGVLNFQGADGSGLLRAAQISAQIDGTPGANDMPGRLVFSTTADGASSPTERMRIDNAGNMSFNGTNVTTSNGGVGQVYKFFGGANNIVLPFESTGAGHFGIFEYRRTGRSGSARASQIQIGENSSNQGRIDVISSAANSDVGGGVRLENAATSWSSMSDIRLKNILSHFDNALADVSVLDAFRFTWKSDANEIPQVGLSAQSVQAVLPEAVGSGKPINAPEDDDTEYLSVRYTEIIPLLVAALQESKERIEALEAEVAALKVQ